MLCYCLLTANGHASHMQKQANKKSRLRAASDSRFLLSTAFEVQLLVLAAFEVQPLRDSTSGCCPRMLMVVLT